MKKILKNEKENFIELFLDVESGEHNFGECFFNQIQVLPPSDSLLTFMYLVLLRSPRPCLNSHLKAVIAAPVAKICKTGCLRLGGIAGKPTSRKLSKYQMDSGASCKLFQTKKGFQLLSSRVIQLP